MYNFNIHLNTNIHFGKGQINKLGKDIIKYTDRLLLVYGGGSIKKNGIYHAIVAELNKYGIHFEELAGVDPNPRIESVREGIKLCRENNLGGVLAVGGGSSIDCSKVIAAGVKYEGDPWDLVLDRKKVVDALPIFTVLTLSATGSEMNSGAVISNMTTNQKLGTGMPGITLPKASVLDPEYTYTVPAKQTAAGTADIISHTFENYFTNVEGGYLQARFAEAILKTCFHYGPIACQEPDNYEARANLMWASSWAINGLISGGTANNWSVHPMEHELSAYYDVTHGVGLAILTPHWMRYVLNDATLDNFVDYGVNVWGIDPSMDKYDIANKAIDMTQDFFCKDLNIPASLTELGINEEYFQVMAQHAAKVKGGSIQGFVNLEVEDIVNIYKAAL
ncbi:butanol dehydrogenase [Peptostreptococcus sp. MV1]|uniref:iron-containing alcohol dehydrogenase n=1 Tax=Peptostreptococcus sp. MV1 TaxID=1219626 RepID=UPI00050F7F2A|nr:iron-containing alcohol dehydrogenase [Peptostreptococcus sp. MV1]KGF14414.1 butanol dehydrogenase [Peptostreptococcus sp. MV1]